MVGVQLVRSIIISNMLSIVAPLKALAAPAILSVCIIPLLTLLAEANYPSQRVASFSVAAHSTSILFKGQEFFSRAYSLPMVEKDHGFNGHT